MKITWIGHSCFKIESGDYNVVMQNMLVREGFVHRGTIYVREDNEPRMAFERI